MKPRLLLLLLTLMLISGLTLNVRSQAPVETKITLKLRNAEPEQYVIIRQLGKEEISRDSFWIDKPETTIECLKYLKEEDLITIHFQRSLANLFLPLYQDDVQIEMDMALCKGASSTNRYTIITGSIAAIEFQGVVDYFSPILRYKEYYYHQKITELRQEGGSDSLINYYQSQRIALRNLDIKWKTDIFKQTQSPLVAQRILISISNDVKYNVGIAISDEEIKALYKDYAQRFPEYSTTKGFVKYADNIIRRGGRLYPFTLPNRQGEPVSLGDYKGRYVLLSFWASWSAASREENYYLKEALQTFRDKNLTIISVSMDKDKDAWLEAITEAGLEQANWVHLYEGKGFEGEVMKAYQVRFMPNSFLISPEGEVLIMNLAIRGEKLIGRLKQFLEDK